MAKKASKPKKKNWIQAAREKMEEKGTVGSFSKAAKKAGKSTSAMTSSVLKKGSKASSAMKKKAQFAKNMAKIRRKKK